MGADRPRGSGYLPSLDGWRALAILGVILTHDLPWVVAGHSDGRWKGYGGWGVQLFFAISGVLICTRILEEERELGEFRIGAFYVRRLFRIQPAAFCYLIAIACLRIAGVIHEQWHYWLGAAFLYQNYLFHALRPAEISAGFFTGHFWTLAVEEHFYILLSLFLYFVRRRRAATLAGLIALLMLLQKIATGYGYFSEDVSNRRTFWQLQFLLIPALFAILLQRPGVRRVVDRYLHPWVAYLLTFGLMVINHTRHREHGAPFWSEHFVPAESAVLFVGFSLWIIASMTHGGSWTTRVLEQKPLRLLGRLSYSIYLWHVLFFVSLAPLPVTNWPPLLFLSERPYKYLASLGMALLSYYVVEKPMIRLGHRLAPPATPGHRDLGPAAGVPGDRIAQARSL